MVTERLAIDGGTPLISSKTTWPPADDEVREALQQAFADGSWGRYEGPNNERLIDALIKMHGVKFALPCCSGTFAVELALRALRIGQPDEVLLAGYDFSGNFRAIEAVGATPVLVDISPDTWCMDADAVEAAITKDTRAVLVSHLHGGIADLQRLRNIADRHQMVIIEDACQAPGALVQGRIAGTWGNVAVLSFGGSKLLTSGRGGAILTNDESAWQRAKIFCERGNHAFPLSELQAAVLIPQLTKLQARNQHRRQSVQVLLEQTKSLAALQAVRLPPPESAASYFKLAWKYDREQCGDWPRDRFLAAAQAEGVAIDAGFRGFIQRGSRCRRSGTLDRSKSAAESTVLLHHPVLLESQPTIELVARALEKVIASAQKQRT